MTIYKEMKKDIQIWKFCFYGLFKNLKFFEPYLVIYLLGIVLNLFQIGILYAIREAITYVFEIPSGIIADHYGKKKELLICFTFYIISFALFFISGNYLVISLAMIFFGLGEAFRSGTHKAMILSYLEHKGWYEYKGYVYGHTRSYFLIGYAISAFISIIPYILDFILILTYPSFLDESKETERSLKNFFQKGKQELISVKKNKVLIKIILSFSTYDGVFKTIKDYIQPILSSLILVVGIKTIMNLDQDQTMKVYWGIIYGLFYIFSSLASKNIFRLTGKFSSKGIYDIFYDLMGVLIIVMAVATSFHYIYLNLFVFFLVYLLKDSRRAVFLDVCSDHMNKEQRATVLSIESQTRALLIIFMAPLFGWIADTFSIGALFVCIGSVLWIANWFLTSRER